MRYLAKIIQVFLPLLIIEVSMANAYEGIEKKIVKIIKKGEIYRSAQVDSHDKLQSLDYKIFGLHPNKCKYALKKLSKYERFHEYLDIVKLSGYDKKKKLIYLYLDSTILPFPMVLNFKIERIEGPGLYKFSFDKGFLKGLKGNIIVKEDGDKCLFHASSYWKGQKSSIPDTIFEIFSETVGELVMKNLFRVSKQI